MSLHQIILGFIGLFLVFTSQAQEVFWPAHVDSRWEQDAFLRFQTDSLRHFGLRPTRATLTEDSAFHVGYNVKYHRKNREKLIGRKLFNEHLFDLKKEKFGITADVLFNFQGGIDLEDTANKILSTNTRGIQIQGYITKKVYFYTSFYENQSFFPEYINEEIRTIGVVPGQGNPKGYGETGYDYNMASGVVRFVPTTFLSFQYGHDKLFIGEGYRSVLLSDNTFNYPFLQAEIGLFKNRLLYQVNYAFLQDDRRVTRINEGDVLNRRKLANINYISFKPFKRLEIGFSEVVMWQRWDDSTGTLATEPLYLNPLPFVNSIVDKDTINNSYLGINASYSPIDYYTLYGQLLYSNDEFSAFQIGAKAYDAFGFSGLYLQVEYNETQNAYGSGDLQTDFYQYGQNLAFVQGDNSSEFIASARYTFRGFYGQVRGHSIHRQNEYINLYSAELGYLINPRYNLTFYGGLTQRESNLSGNTQWFYGGLRTSILNAYYDF